MNQENLEEDQKKTNQQVSVKEKDQDDNNTFELPHNRQVNKSDEKDESKAAAQAINLLLEERQKFILIGLTGKTGSGCSTTATLLNSKMFEDFNPPEVIHSNFTNNEERKYEIVHHYLKSNWHPFNVIKVSNIISTFLLDYTYIDFVQELTKLQLQRKQENTYVLTDVFNNSTLKTEVQTALKKNKLPILDKTFEELFNEMRDIRETVKHLYTHKNNEPKSKPKYNEMYNAYDFYFEKLPLFSKQFRDLLDELEPKLSSQVLQALGNNIRTSGFAFCTDFEPGNVLELSQRTNNLVKLLRDYIKHIKKEKKILIVIDAFRNPYEITFFKDRYSAFHLFSINSLEEDRKTRIRTNLLNEKDIDEIDEVESGAQTKNKTKEKFTNQNIPECLQIADIHLFNPQEDDGNYHELKRQLAKYITLIMHPGLITPTNIERCMQVALTAKVNSGCLSRQVGAVVTDINYSVKTIGWNDVPEGQIPCNLRSLTRLIKGNDKNAFSEFERTDKKFIEFYKSKAEHKLNNPDVSDRVFTYCFKDLYNGSTDKDNQVHTRSLHAEENAFLQLTKYGGMGIKGGYLFTTASPCELCSKKAYQLGITKIYYIDEYPGIAQKHILNNGSNQPELILYKGTIGTSYHKLYTPLMPIKDELYTLFDISFK